MHGPSETHSSETHGPAEGSPWPSYVIGGGMVAAGVALWVSPILSLAQAGDYESVQPGSPRVVQEVGMDGGQVGLAIAGSLLLVAGATLCVGRWLRTSGSVTNEGASVSVAGDF